MTPNEIVVLKKAMEIAFGRMSEADVDAMLKEQNADITRIMEQL